MEPITDLELRAFVGSNADYYCRRWLPFVNKRRIGSDQVGVVCLMFPQPKTGFNWAALFLGPFWFPYRKMYLLTAMLYSAIIIEMLVEDVWFAGILGAPNVSDYLSRFFLLSVAVVCGAFGNRCYLFHSKKLIAGVRTGGLEIHEYLQAIAKRGGVSLPASFACFLALIIVMRTLAMVIDVLLYHVDAP